MVGARKESHTFLKRRFLVKPMALCVPIINKKILPETFCGMSQSFTKIFMYNAAGPSTMCT